jgi:hypothetical protein
MLAGAFALVARLSSGPLVGDVVVDDDEDVVFGIFYAIT